MANRLQDTHHVTSHNIIKKTSAKVFRTVQDKAEGNSHVNEELYDEYRQIAQSVGIRHACAFAL